ncbi:MAG: methylated-DNA--[protein]-cysteine S-methyltransferase [Candidatus Krumholzibacteriia bacterium]
MTRPSWCMMDTPVGRLHLAAGAEGLTHVVYPGRDHGRPRGDGSTAAAVHLEAAVRQLGEYFAGARRTFDLTLALAGSDLRLAIWRRLSAIAPGEVTSYGALAGLVGRPGAARAVGTAVGANPLSIVLPCHRVVGADGKLHGYAGGLDAKRWLLSHEGAPLPRGRR